MDRGLHDFDAPLSAEDMANVNRDKVDTLVSHLWRASGPFQKVDTSLLDIEWLVALRRLYEAVATGNPQFGGWASPEYKQLTECQLVDSSPKLAESATEPTAEVSEEPAVETPPAAETTSD